MAGYSTFSRLPIIIFEFIFKYVYVRTYVFMHVTPVKSNCVWMLGNRCGCRERIKVIYLYQRICVKRAGPFFSLRPCRHASPLVPLFSRHVGQPHLSHTCHLAVILLLLFFLLRVRLRLRFLQRHSSGLHPAIFRGPCRSLSSYFLLPR